MSTLGSLLNTARDGLAAQAYGLSVTGQNISNVSTPGYVRREAVLETRPLSQTQGSVDAAGLRRITDQWTERRWFESAGLASAAQERDGQLVSVEAVFNDTEGTGLGDSLDNLFNSFSGLSASPGDLTTRANVLERAGAFSDRSRDIAGGIAAQKAEQLRQAQDTVEEINKRAAELAKINKEISQATASGKDAADLRDYRNQVLLGIAGLVDVRTLTDGQGNLVVQAAGTTLVEGDIARTLSVNLSSDGNMRVLAQYKEGPPSDVTSRLTGGKLAGIKEARDADLASLEKRLDQLVFDVGTALNTQHSSGFGLDGSTGNNLFVLSATASGAARSIAVDPALLGHPERLAAAGDSAALPGDGANATRMFSAGARAIAAMGMRTPAEEYAAIVGEVGLRRAGASQALVTREAIQAQTENSREALSGVSLDEEFVSLTQYQRAYEASSKVLSVADELLAELIARVG